VHADGQERIATCVAFDHLERVWEICSSCFRCVIQALDVDRAESWPDGEDCQEDEALPI
jgi:hypothetical protein